jgi:hypothetical protein
MWEFQPVLVYLKEISRHRTVHYYEIYADMNRGSLVQLRSEPVLFRKQYTAVLSVHFTLMAVSISSEI